MFKNTWHKDKLSLMKSTRLNLYLPASLVESLKNLADNDGRSLNAYVGRVLQRHVEDRMPNKTQEAKSTEIPISCRWKEPNVKRFRLDIHRRLNLHPRRLAQENATRRFQRKKSPRNPNCGVARSIDLNSLQYSTSRSHDHAEPVDSRLPTASHKHWAYCTPRILVQDIMAKNTNATSQSRAIKLAAGLE